MPGSRARAGAAALAALAICACAEPAPPRGLLLVTVDTLRADALGAYGAQGGLTPRLDALAEQALVFDAAYAPAPFTFPSIASLWSGRYPGALGIRTNLSQLPADVPTLASRLRERGFRTGAAVSSSVLHAKAGLADDFDVYDDQLLQREQTREAPERIAAVTTDAALAVLDRLLAPPAQSARFLLWVHYQDPHGPYTPPPEYGQRAAAFEHDTSSLPVLPDNHGGHGIPAYQALGQHREVSFYRGGYRGEVAYVDTELGRLLDGLAERGLAAASLVVFTADHGEALGEHDVWFAHGHDLTDELVRVPLLLRAPGVAPGRRTDVVSLVDLYPTLLARLGAGAASDGLPGRDLLAAGASERESTPYLDTLSYGATRRTGLVAEGYKLILTWQDGSWRARLFRRGDEDVDLAAPAPQVATRLRERLIALHDESERSRRAETQQPLTDEERARLEALGYGVPEAP
jgi:arylsulfatase A-like enzyme